jgi:hypothetical protein
MGSEEDGHDGEQGKVKNPPDHRNTATKIFFILIRFFWSPQGFKVAHDTVF